MGIGAIVGAGIFALLAVIYTLQKSSALITILLLIVAGAAGAEFTLQKLTKRQVKPRLPKEKQS